MIPKKFILFCIVGFGALFIDWAFFNLFYFFWEGFILAKILSTIISMIFNFTTNRNYTFKAKTGSIHSQFFKWIILYIVSGTANILVGKTVLSILGETTLNANIAFFSGLLVSTPLNFFGSLFWAFKRKY